jgi:hypothetical protein
MELSGSQDARHHALEQKVRADRSSLRYPDELRAQVRHRTLDGQPP